MTAIVVEPTQLPEADPDTITPHPERPNVFWVKGTSFVYELFRNPTTGVIACECPGFRRHHHCYHAHALRLYLWQERVCPTCAGKGWVHAHEGSGLLYVRRGGLIDAGPWPLPCCWGTGLRSEWEGNEPHFAPGEYADVYCPAPAVPRPEEKR